MKTSNSILSLLVGTLSLATFTALASNDEFTHSYIAKAQYLEGSGGAKLFALGDSVAKVTNLLDKPDLQLSPSVWLYRHFPAEGNRETRKHFCDNLIVAFGPGQKPAGQRVTAIVMVNSKGLEKIESELKQNPRYLEDLQPES